MAKFDLPQRIEAEYQTSMFKLMAAIPIASAIEKRTDISRTRSNRMKSRSARKVGFSASFRPSEPAPVIGKFKPRSTKFLKTPFFMHCDPTDGMVAEVGIPQNARMLLRRYIPFADQPAMSDSVDQSSTLPEILSPNHCPLGLILKLCAGCICQRQTSVNSANSAFSLTAIFYFCPHVT
jgi:hypothetical protein